MTDMHDNEDLILDRNLRALGRQLTLPHVPTREQKQSWKHRESDGGLIAEHRNGATNKLGNTLMKKYRMWTVTGSAIAATIAISAAIWMIPGQTPVNAATIFQSLREATTRGLNVWIDHVKQDGLEIDGRVQVSFDRSGDAAAGQRSDEVGFAELRILANEAHPRVPGLDLEVALSTSPGQEWLFLKTHRVPAGLIADEPLLGILAAYASSGVLLELDGLVRQEGASSETAADQTPAGDRPPFGKRGFSVGFQVNSDITESEGASKGPDTSKIELATQFELGGNAAPQDAALSDLPGDVDVGSFKRAGAILEDVFRGEMTPDQLTTVIDWIEASAGSVSVNEQGGGTYVLTARDFDLSDLPLDDRSAARVAHVELEIAYRQDTGIQGAALRNVGDGDGSIRFEQTETEIDTALLDRARFTQDENVKVINLNTLTGMLGISVPN